MTDQAQHLPCRPADIERALRACGLSRKQARAVLAGGLPAVGLDVADDEQHVAGDDDVLVAELKRAAAALRGDA